MERIGHWCRPEVAEDPQPSQIVQGGSENHTTPNRKHRKTPPVSKVPSKVPREWIQKAVRFLKDPCFCNATVYGLWRVFSPDQLAQIIPKDLMRTAFRWVINEVRLIGWGRISELTDSNGKEHYGVFLPCRDQGDGDCIKLNRNLHPVSGQEGDFKQIEGSDVPLRYLVILHEALHKLFKLWGPDAVKTIESLDVERIIEKILATYLGRPDMLAEPSVLAKELFDAVSACRVLGHCDRLRPAMAPPVGPAPKTVELQPDYNNDGRADASSGTIYCRYIADANGEQRRYMDVYEHSPKLCLGDRECFYDPMGLYYDGYHGKKCPLPQPYQIGEVWDVDRADYQAWLKPPSFASFLRFFNTDQTMHFVPGQLARVRGLDVQGSIERLIVRIDPTTGVQAGPVYAELPQCAMIPVDDLVWVDAEGVALDMRALMAAARMPTPNDAEDKSTQGRMRVLLQSALSVAADPVKSPPEKRDAILAYAQAFSGREKLPDGWEESVLLALDLPREVPPPKAPCTGPSCGPPPGGSPDQPPRTKTRTTMVR